MTEQNGSAAAIERAVADVMAIQRELNKQTEAEAGRLRAELGPKPLRTADIVPDADIGPTSALIGVMYALLEIAVELRSLRGAEAPRAWQPAGGEGGWASLMTDLLAAYGKRVEQAELTEP
jgi:hypothetical protein